MYFLELLALFKLEIYIAFYSFFYFIPIKYFDLYETSYGIRILVWEESFLGPQQSTFDFIFLWLIICFIDLLLSPFFVNWFSFLTFYTVFYLLDSFRLYS